MSYTRGKPLNPATKKAIILIKQYFDRNKSIRELEESSVQMAADALEIGVATVNRILAAYHKNPESLNEPPKARGRPAYAVDSFHDEAVRSYIRQANIHGEYITLETIREFLTEQFSTEPFHISTLARTLDRWGFEFGKGKRTQHLKEKDHVIAARRRYLRRMRNNRKNLKELKTIRPEVYLDESYVNKNHSNDFVWYSGEDGPWIQKPTGKGERLIIVNAITCNGWVPEAKLVFKSSRKTGDYHGQMNYELFSKWFREKLIPNIPKNSIIIMDNASYHNHLADSSAPTSACSKAHILSWLHTNGVPCESDCLKVELIEILQKIAPTPTYSIDEIASSHGHEVLRTPPYHPELQPIETCWGVLKNHVARNCNFTMENLYHQLDNAFAKVTDATCRRIIKKVREKENQFWKEDSEIDRRIDI